MNPYEIVGVAAILAACVLTIGGYIAYQYEPVCRSTASRAVFTNDKGETFISLPIETQTCTYGKKGGR